MTASTQRLAIIGCGFMGSAILQGLLRVPPSESGLQLQYTAHVHSPSSLARLKQDFSAHSDSIRFSHGNSQLISAVEDADIILLGFVPGDLEAVLETNKGAFATHLQGKLIISMLAGISSAKLLEALQANVINIPHTATATPDFDIVRIIPTLGARIGESITLIAQPSPSSSSSSSSPAISSVEAIFSRIGSIHQIPERLMDTATAIGAAIHALAIVAVDSATDASIADGMPRATALALTAQCLRSCSGLMLPEGGMTPESVKAAMSTPAGITLNAVVHLDANVRSGIAGTVRNAVKYAKGME